MIKTSLFLGFSLFAMTAFANNVTVTNLSEASRNTSTKEILLQFDLRWENSWRTDPITNAYDAVWIIVKYRNLSSSTWGHAILKATQAPVVSGSTNYLLDGHSFFGSSSQPGEIVYSDDTGADGANGVFIQMKNPGTPQSVVTFNGVQLTWKYSANGIGDTENFEYSVQAIEMVYVPDADFYVGDGNGTTQSVGAYFGAANTAVKIEDGILTDINYAGGAGFVPTVKIDGLNGVDTNNDGIIDNPNYPTGWKAFYIMKYEATQDQYVSFLNKISGATSSGRYVVPTTVEINRGYAITETLGVFATTAPFKPVTILNSTDISAYLDFAALRYMTPFEYEKACRGTSLPLLNELAWGQSTSSNIVYTITNENTDIAIITNPQGSIGNANFSVNTNNKYFRVGIFSASSPNFTRDESGAGFYGAMELSGNLSEIVTRPIASGYAYTGNHGDGIVAGTNQGNVEGWPDYNGAANNAANSYAYKGGDVFNTKLNGSVSRNEISQLGASTKVGSVTIRGVRTAPRL